MLTMMRTYLRNFVGQFVRDEKGQGMVEYGLIIAVVALVAVVGLGLLGNHMSTFFQGLTDNITE